MTPDLAEGRRLLDEATTGKPVADVILAMSNFVIWVRDNALLDLAEEGVAFLDFKAHVAKAEPVEWDSGPSPIIGQVKVGDQWMPPEWAYGYALRVLAAVQAVFGDHGVGPALRSEKEGDSNG